MISPSSNEAEKGSARGITLPAKIPVQRYRPAQSNIPDSRPARDRLKRLAEDRVREVGAIPPLTLDELREHTAVVLRRAALEDRYEDYTAILVSNAAWHESLARIPYDRRLLLLPKCLRVEEQCPAPFDEFGLLCKECGLCSSQDLTVEAERLGYAVLVAEGSAIVRRMIETGRIEAIVGVSCINVLEKCFPHMEAAAIPGVAIPLLQDDCANTTVDLDWVWDVIHLTSADRTYRLDLDALKREVRGWFERESLDALLGPADDETAKIARDWLTRGGKRWRPYLAACTYMALRLDAAGDGQTAPPAASPDLRKMAVAIECFHKASLIHDDIEDGDEKRDDRPALHVETGLPVALNVGDFLLGEGYRLLGELTADPRLRLDILRAASAGHVTLSRGQGRELAWARRPKPLPSLEVLDIFRQKTAAAFEVALRLGAFLGEADEATHNVLTQYSESLGIAYQIRDDLHDFGGLGANDTGPNDTGHGDAGHADPTGSGDLEEMRLSLILAIAHKRARDGAEKALIESVLRHETHYADVSDSVRKILTERRVLEKADQLQEAYKEEAIRSLRFLSSPTLKGLLRRVVGKIFGEPPIEGYCSEFEARNAASRAARAEPSQGGP